MVAALPPLFILSARGVQIIKNKKVLAAVLAAVIFSGFFLSLDSITKYHDGFRKAGIYVDENARPGELIFYTGMPTVLFYHEVDSGNWWRYGDYNRTQDIRYVIIEYHAYTKRQSIFGFFDLERFESDFSPAAIFRNEDALTEIDIQAAGIAVEDVEHIKIYRVDKDISDYFRSDWSS